MLPCKLLPCSKWPRTTTSTPNIISECHRIVGRHRRPCYNDRSQPLFVGKVEDNAACLAVARRHGGCESLRDINSVSSSRGGHSFSSKGLGSLANRETCTA